MFELARAIATLSLLVFTWSAVAEPLPSVRFLLTFDDGPSLWRPSPTADILRQLAHNPVMPNVAALFFVQSVHRAHGGSDAGRQLMQQTCAAGHVLGLHSGSARGHVTHPSLAPQELAESLRQGNLAIERECPGAVGFVRPPDWVYTDATLAAYDAAHLEMLQADISANDGKIYGWNISLRRRAHLRKGLERVALARTAGQLPVVDGVLPVIVAFHDTNTYTAEHMTEYLQILVEESREIGLPSAAEPFYANAPSLARAAHVRAKQQLYVCDSVALSTPMTVRLGLSSGDKRRGCF
jgi:peptidoglycan/xylan/chitin deacetylase (PgdA/CDA1 family)